MIKNTHDMSELAVRDRLAYAAANSIDDVLLSLHTTKDGISETDLVDNVDLFGSNQIETGKKIHPLVKFFMSFINPFTLILIALAVVSFFVDFIMADVGDKDLTTAIIIIVMVLISGILEFVQESKSSNAAEALSAMVKVTTLVKRNHEEAREVDVSEVVVGDVIYLSAGDMIPADVRIIEAKDLFITQAALTGESEHIEKFAHDVNILDKAITATENLAFMGSDVISGSAKVVVVAVGNDTIFGSISASVTEVAEKTAFEIGVDSVSMLLIRFMLVMVPIVLFVNGFTKGDWLQAFMFAVSVAVGLTPEMLPMIVTTSLAKGAQTMSKEKTIVKNLSAIQNIGSMDILCTDKTGTLTQDEIILEYHLDVFGQENHNVLKHAFLNSYFQTGLRNLLDKSIIKRVKQLKNNAPVLRNLEVNYHKVDEVPFDFERRRMSVVVEDKNGKTQMITKGAVEEMIGVCDYVQTGDKVVKLEGDIVKEILHTVDDLNSRGMRVIAVAQKTNPSPVGHFGVKDESEMVLIGYLAFLDPPKESARPAINSLAELGVETKVLTGDNDVVTKAICDMIGIPTEVMVLGDDVDIMSDEELSDIVEKVNVFAKLSPMQKSRVVTTLRNNGHTVGFLGDGINDAPAMKAADIGISVDNAVDIAKESSEVILLEKDLGVLEKAIIEGRKTYANMIKYIKMTASSNFGNVFSVLVASAFLPFLPMQSLHLILLNLIYDITCIAIPWDNVDKEYLKVPRKWDASSIKDFMLIIGPTSSIFDITTYLLMFFVISPLVTGYSWNAIPNASVAITFIAVFQAGWFIESMVSQTLVIHMIRTEKIPFLQSRASGILTLLSVISISIAIIIPYTGFGASIGMYPLPPIYYFWLVLTIIGYMLVVSIAKKYFIKKYGELL